MGQILFSTAQINEAIGAARSIAPIETTSTASQAYSIGDLFVYGGLLYRATESIAQGGTITPNTNCTATAVGTEIVGKFDKPSNAGTTGQVLKKTAGGSAWADESGGGGASVVAEQHRNIFRGQYLGTEVTAEQYDAIDAGTFDNLYIGDYWTADGVNWRIADADFWLHKGDTECATHHLVIVPDAALYTSPMNDSGVVAYQLSKMRTTYLDTAKAMVNTAFGSSHILVHRERFTSSSSGGIPGDWSNVDSTVDLMSEVEVYGTSAWSSSPKYEVGLDYPQFALFRLAPKFAAIRASWWLRNLYSSSSYCYVHQTGHASADNYSNSFGVRPAFGICKANPS